MKRYGMVLGTILAVFSLSQCSKDTTEILNQNEPVFLRAELAPVTKVETTPEGKVSWTADDKLSAMIVPAGSTTWGKLSRFSTDATLLQSNSFKLDVHTDLKQPDLSKPTDWYVIYPSFPLKNKFKDPTGVISSGGYVDLETVQEHSMKDPSLHLSNNSVMVGVAENVEAGTEASVNLRHVLCFHKFTLVNGESQSIKINDIQLESSADLAAKYDVNFKTGELIARTTPKKVVNVHITSPDKIAVGESMDVYFLTAPFTLPVNGTFTLRVLSDAGKFEKTMTAQSEIVFKAGTINTSTITVQGSVKEEAPTLHFNEGHIDLGGTFVLGEKMDVISGTEKYAGLKLGTGSAVGSYETPILNLTGDHTLTLYAYAWNKGTSQLKISVLGGGSIEGGSDYIVFDLDGDPGFHHSSPFTVNINPLDLKTIKLTGLVADKSKLKFESLKKGDKRAMVVDPRFVPVGN